MPTRRRFIQILLAAPAVDATAALAQPKPELVDEKNPQAAALGYVSDTARADKAKFPRYVAGQTCAGCQLYSGKSGEASGPCSIFQGKHVAARGWCSTWVKRA